MTSLMAAGRAFYAEKGPGRLSTKRTQWEARCGYFDEELHEFLNAHPGTPHRAKEAADLLFTLAGLMDEEGIDLDVAFALVCASNMTKERTVNGKVRKGPDYVEPDMRGSLLATRAVKLR